MGVTWLSAQSLVYLIERNKTVTLYARCELPLGEGSLVIHWYCGTGGIRRASPSSELVLDFEYFWKQWFLCEEMFQDDQRGEMRLGWFKPTPVVRKGSTLIFFHTNTRTSPRSLSRPCRHTQHKNITSPPEVRFIFSTSIHDVKSEPWPFTSTQPETGSSRKRATQIPSLHDKELWNANKGSADGWVTSLSRVTDDHWASAPLLVPQRGNGTSA